MSRITRLSTVVYRALLWAYPAEFRRTYGTWMMQAFRDQCREAQRSGTTSLLRVWAVTLVDWAYSFPAEHWAQFSCLSGEQAMNKRLKIHSARDLQKVRWLLRAVSLFLLVFIGYPLVKLLLIPGFVYPQALPFVAVLLFECVMLVLAWRWEIMGGKIAMAGGALLSIVTIVYVINLSQMLNVDLPLVGVLVSAVWGLPFIILGWLYVEIGQRTHTMAATPA